MSRIAVCVWALIMGAIMCIAQVAGINVNWLITIIGAMRCQLPVSGLCSGLPCTLKLCMAESKFDLLQVYSRARQCRRCGAR